MERRRRWINQTSNERLLLMDIGSGFNTPGVIRWPMEQIAAHVSTARLVRINLHDARVPRGLGERGLPVWTGAREAIEAIGSALHRTA
jgi:hypothetical protein